MMTPEEQAAADAWRARMKAPLMGVCEGDETTVRNANDEVLLQVLWDGKEAGDGGVNDVLFALVDAFNAIAEQDAENGVGQ